MFTLKKTLFTVAAAANAGVLGAPTPSTNEVNKLDKPIISPPLPDLSRGLLNNLGGSIEAIERWPVGLANEDCKTWFERNDYDVSKDLEMYNVTFTDCTQPWVMCRHRSAPYKIDVTAAYYSRLPVIMRSYTRHVIALPIENHGGKAVINQLDNVIIKGNPTFHEILVGLAKSMDYHGYRVVGPYHRTLQWEKAYDTDSAVPNALAQLNQEENLAQLMVVALYDKRVVGGIASAVPQWEKIRNQYEQIEKDAFEDTFFSRDGLKCPERAPDSLIVPCHA